MCVSIYMCMYTHICIYIYIYIYVYTWLLLRVFFENYRGFVLNLWRLLFRPPPLVLGKRNIGRGQKMLERLWRPSAFADAVCEGCGAMPQLAILLKFFWRILFMVPHGGVPAGCLCAWLPLVGDRDDPGWRLGVAPVGTKQYVPKEFQKNCQLRRCPAALANGVS